MKSILFIVISIGLAAATACGTAERRAEDLYEEASARFEAMELEEGVEILQRILREYPDTEAAERAAKDVGLYSGIAGAVRNYPVSEARLLLVRTARVLEPLRRRRRLPADLGDLVPGKLKSVPVDPWGHGLVYTRHRGGRGYTLQSLGADGLQGGQAEAADLVVRNGEFVEGAR